MRKPGADRPQRPLTWVCAAVCMGSIAGSYGALEAGLWKLVVAAVGLAFVVLLLLRPALRAGRHSAALLFWIGCIVAWRGSLERQPGAALAALEPGGVHAPGLSGGRWAASPSFGDDERGEIEGGSERFVLARGLVREGETLAILPGEEPRAWPRGPEPGPSRNGGFAQPARRVLPDEIVRLAPAGGGLARRLSQALSELRARLIERCSSLEQPLTRALVKALLFGDMTEMPREVSDLFVRVGTYHVLAISGSQVGLVAVLILWPLSRLASGVVRRASFGRWSLAPEFLHVALLFLFVPIAGAGAPVLRSAVAYALGAWAPRAPRRRSFARVRGRELRLGRKAEPLSLWSLALIGECLWHASAPLSLSVQLSYGATLGLILGTGPILRWMRSLWWGEGRIAAVDALGRPRASWWRIPVQRLLDLGWCSLAASLAAVLATLPWVWTRFGEWSPVGILATPALGLPMAWLLALGWLRLLVPGAVPQILVDLPARGMIAEMQFFDRWPGSPDPLPPRPFALLGLATVLTFCWIARSCPRSEPDLALAAHAEQARAAGRSTLLCRSALLTWMVLLLPWTLAASRFELWALDVGHGTAVVFRAPGSGTWLFDGGSRDRPDVAREALLPLLRTWETDEIGVVLSHDDRDHDGALAYVIERYPPRIWAGALPAQCAERLPHTTLALDSGPGRIELPRLSDREGGVELRVCRGSDQAGNEGSRSLLVRTGADLLWLSGDAEGDGLAQLMTLVGADGRTGPPVRLLLFPHHGSDTAQLGPLLASTRPAEIWISCSTTPAVLAEIDRRGIPCRTTARSGPLGLALRTNSLGPGDAP